MKRTSSFGDYSLSINYGVPDHTLTSMPIDICLLFFANLPSTCMNAVSLVCRSWQQIFSHKITWQYLFHAHYPNPQNLTHENYQASYKKQFLMSQNLPCGIYSSTFVKLPSDIGGFKGLFKWKEKLIAVAESFPNADEVILTWNLKEVGKGESESVLKYHINGLRARWIHSGGKLYVGVGEKIQVIDLNSEKKCLETVLDLGKNKDVRAISIQNDTLSVTYNDKGIQPAATYIVIFDLLANKKVFCEQIEIAEELNGTIMNQIVMGSTVMSVFLDGKYQIAKLHTKDTKSYNNIDHKFTSLIQVDDKVIVGFDSGNIGVMERNETALCDKSPLDHHMQTEIVYHPRARVESEGESIQELCSLGEGKLFTLSANGKISIWNLRSSTFLIDLKELQVGDERVNYYPSFIIYDEGKLIITDPILFGNDNSKGKILILDFNVTLNACLEEIATQLASDDEALQHEGWRRFKRLPEKVKQKIYQSFSNDPERAQLFKAMQEKGAIIRQYLDKC